jgi:polar amino acid transport system substrate-binding protein
MIWQGFSTSARVLGLCATVAALLGTSSGLAQETGTPSDGAFEEILGHVPNYWDFKTVGDRPSAEDLGSVRFLMSDDFPPFSYLARDGQLAGFHVDFARALCAELQISCQILVRPYNDLLGTLGDGKGDAILSGISVPTALAQGLLLSDTYLTTPARFAAKAGSGDMPTVQEMAGRSISFVTGTAHEAFLKGFFSQADLKPYDSRFAARRALREGEVDFTFGDGLSLSLWLNGEQSRGCCQFVGGPYLEPRFFGNGFAMAFSPTRPELKQGFDYAIREIFKSGKFAELYLRYFPVSFF